MAEKLIQDWLPNDVKLLPFYIGIDEFLGEYLESIRHDDLDKISPKIIADPLLGYIHFSSLEVSVIDTKLFQRLRRIKQLGLAHLVFPSLGYSRFEHSLGVVGRLNQVLNKIIENNQRSSEADTIKLIVDEYKVSIRLAALLHDLGHCLFSHCSERVIEKIKAEPPYPDAAYIQDVFTSFFKKEKKIPFAEIFSVVIVGSKRFAEFIDSLNAFNKKEVRKILSQVAFFILGKPIDQKPETIFLAQLISSGLDADKIDYMVREQHYSGIKLEIDLDRILSKLRVFDLKSYELPKNLEYLKKFFNADANFKVVGFEKGGQFAFEEFCVARLALHVKIYLHQKVRAAESQLSKYLESIADSPILKEVHNWLKIPESIVEYPEIINQRFSFNGSLFNSFQLNAKQINCFKKIDKRDIFYRAFAFGPMNSYSEGYENGDAIAINEKISNYFDVFKIDHLKELIIAEATNICDEYSIDVDINQLDEITIEIPRLINIQQGQESIYFERASWLPLKWTIPIDRILIYFQENRALAYVFSPSEIAYIISVATEKVLFEHTSKVFAQEANLSRNTFNEATTLKSTLTAKGFYKQFPQLKLVSEYLTKAEASEKIKYVQEKLAGFKSLNDEHVTINRITTFVNQFPEDLQDVCLSFLQHLEIYGENLLKEEVEKVLLKVSLNGTRIGVSHLGMVADSGGRLAYYIRPLFEKYNIESFDVNDNFVLENDKIVFYDDNINSGLQVINIFAELLEMKDKLPNNLRLNEKHHRKLVSKEAKEKFVKMPIYLTYIVGYEGSENRIKEVLSEYLGFNPENIHVQINREFKQNKKIFSGSESLFNHEKKKELRDFLVQIGEKLLKEEKKSSDKIDTCKLGYANAEAMVLFPYNIPTMTITALWCKGLVDGMPWVPLAERRRRSKDGRYIGED